MTAFNGNLLRRTACLNEPGLRCLSGLVSMPVVTTFGIQTKSVANWRNNAGERSFLSLFLCLFSVIILCHSPVSNGVLEGGTATVLGFYT